MVRRTGPRRPRLITDQTTSRRQHFGARQVRPPTNWSRKRPASLAVSGGMSSRTPENWVRRKTGPPSAEESRTGLPDDRNRAEKESALLEADAPAGKIVGRRTSPRPISDKSNASETPNRQARQRPTGHGTSTGKLPDHKNREEQ